MLFIFLFMTLAGVLIQSPVLHNTMAAFLQTITGPTIELVAKSPSVLLVASVSSSAVANSSSITPFLFVNSTISSAIYMATTIVSDEKPCHVTASSSTGVSMTWLGFILNALQPLTVRGSGLLAFGGLSLVVFLLLLSFRFTGSALVKRARMMVRDLDLAFQARFTVIEPCLVGQPSIGSGEEIPLITVLDQYVPFPQPLASINVPWASLLEDVKTVYGVCRIAVMDEWQDFIDNIPKKDSSILEKEVDRQILAQIRAATDKYITIRTAETHVTREEFQKLQLALDKAEDVKIRATKLYNDAIPKLNEYDKHMDLVTEYNDLAGVTRDLQKGLNKLTREHKDLKGHKEAIAMKVKLTIEKRDLEEQLADTVEENNQLKEENDDLQAELDQHKEKDQGEDIDALAEQYEIIQEEKAELETELQQCKDENKELRLQNNSLKIDMKDLNEQISQFDDIEDDLEEDVKKYKELWKSAEDEVEKLEMNLEAKDKEMKARCKEIEEEKNAEMERAVQDAWNSIADAMEDDE